MGIIETVEDAASKVGYELGETWTFWKRMFEQQGDTAAIDAVRDKWTSGDGSVKSYVADAKTGLEEEIKVIHTFWEGPAAEAFYTYQFGLGPKFTALTGICDGISEALESFRETLNDFWMWTYIAIGAAAVALAVSIAAIWVAGIGVGGVVATLAGLVAAMVLYLTQAKQTVEAIRTAINSLQDQTVTDVFPNDKWPRPARDLSDGSVSDGDESDWTVLG